MDVFIVRWTDYVANEWVQAVSGDYEDVCEALAGLAEAGRHKFAMKWLCITQAIGEADVMPVEQPTTIEEFLALDWGVDYDI